MLIKRSIKIELLIFLLGVTTIAIIIIAYITVNSIRTLGYDTQQITSAALRSQAERSLVQITEMATAKNDLVFKEIAIDASNVAAYAENIFEHPETFARDAYWRFDDHIFTGDKGQHMNGMDDVSSVFIPNHIAIDDDLKKGIELSAYLEYVFPKVLENKPSAVAIYFIGLQGEARYYPNIGLGNILPPDDTPNKQIFFTVANPENDPERKVVWTPVYDDPAGHGLMITTTAPIYTEQRGFVGVIGMDITLKSIIKNIEEYNPIEDSYAILIGKDGYSIALPEIAYKDILGRSRQANESRVNLNNLTNEFSAVINKMKGGFHGFENITIRNKELYVAYAPLESIGFSLGIITEKAVMLKVATNLQKEVEYSTQKMIYLRILPVSLLILIILLIAGFLYINRIIRPIKELTETAQEISKGNFNLKSNISSKNEIGELASAFNKMALDLKKSRKELKDYSKNLENKVRERTKEFEEKNEDLEKFKKISIGREINMIELKKKIKELEEEKKK